MARRGAGGSAPGHGAPPWRFADRSAAGEALAERLAGAGARWQRPVVLALPRGGVPVAAPVAQRLEAPLDVLVARKLGAPSQPELGVGAIAEGGALVVDRATVAALGLRTEAVAEVARRERVELQRRVERYRAGRPLPAVEGRDVIIVDDGLATGVTAEAAVAAVRGRGAARVVVAAPVGAPGTVARLGALADDVVCLLAPNDFRAVGLWYVDFRQTTDEEVLAVLDRFHPGGAPPS